MGKNKDKIRVSFGHNSEHVTGSYTLIDCGQSKKKILVDFGLIQENMSLLKLYQINSKRPDFKAKELTYVFLTHAHIDHCGKASLLPRYGCTAPIIMPKGMKPIYKEMALDSAKIMEKDALDLEKKLKKEYIAPIYTNDDVYRSLELVKEYNVGEKIQLDEDISFQFNYTGHILKAWSVTFWIKNGSQTRKIIVTGDIGNTQLKQKFTEDFVPFESCNLLIGECTYSDSKRGIKDKDREKDLEKIKSGIITTCQDKKGSVLIPVFAYGRSPVILATLYDLFYEDSINGNFDIPIIYASPLGVKLLNIYSEELEWEQKEELEKVLNWSNLKILDSFEKLEAEIKNEKPKVICVPGGMCQAGYSVYVASKLLPSAKNTIMFAGYSAEGTLSWKIKQKKTKTITIDGKPVPARCGVINLISFSSHIQREQMIKAYLGEYDNKQFSYDKIALVHSEQKSKIEFGKDLQEEFTKRGKSSKVIIVNKSTEITL